MSAQRLSPDERRRRFLDLGMEMFGERSFEAVSVTDICAAAGVSRPLFEHYFGSKKSFYVACVAHSLEHIDQTVRRPAINSELDDLEARLERMFSFILRHPAGAVILENAGGVAEAKLLVNQFNDETTNSILKTLPDNLQTNEVRIAIECWHGVNSKLIARLIKPPTISTRWAASYSNVVLKSLIAEASSA